MTRPQRSTPENSAIHSASGKHSRPLVSIIVAIAQNRVIGREGKLPWHISEDLKRFRALTMGHHIVMGRRTWESISRLLPGRHHVIVSRRSGYAVAGATVVSSFDEAIAASAGDSEVFVIGGAEIYARALAVADRIYATEIAREFEGDVRFPELDRTQWREVKAEPLVAADVPGRFVLYERHRAG